jgi:hypothetical protein
MSNARNLANLLGTSSTVPDSKMPTGSVIQTLSFEQDGDITTTSTSLVATNFIGSITPQFSNSKILFTLQGGQGSYTGGTNFQNGSLYRQINSGGYSSIFVLYRRNMASVYYEAYSHQYLDSPNTTNQVDYQVYFYVNAHTGYFAMDPTSDNSAVIMLLQEIAQ